MNWKTVHPAIRWAVGLVMAAFAIAYAAGQLAAMAHADPMSMDDQFIALAQRDGFQSHSGYAGLIGSAHQVCTLRMNGTSEASVINEVYLESELTQRSTAAALVHDAELVYCPGYYEGSSGGNSA